MTRSMIEPYETYPLKFRKSANQFLKTYITIFLKTKDRISKRLYYFMKIPILYHQLYLVSYWISFMMYSHQQFYVSFTLGDCKLQNAKSIGLSYTLFGDYYFVPLNVQVSVRFQSQS